MCVCVYPSLCELYTHSKAFVCKCEFVYLCLQRSRIQKEFNQVPHTGLQVQISAGITQTSHVFLGLSQPVIVHLPHTPLLSTPISP